MRTLLALTIFAAAMSSMAEAQSARKAKSGTKLEYSQQQRDTRACEERAEHEDRSGQYANLPCWAREAFARGRNNATN
jgi:Ni/Co efflux regulator RcnB